MNYRASHMFAYVAGGTQFETTSMSRAAWSTLSPWIERRILGYDGSERSKRPWLKAHVIGVGQMSQSQALGSEGPTGLLFLSDGLLQIPGILTAPAWEHLQEREDRESFTSLLNTTLCIQNYQLQFHMDPEETKSRFYIVIGELTATAAGPVKDNTPCCTTLFSVREKISETWKALLGQESQEFHASQYGFDLSELLGEWQNDGLQDIVEDIKEKLMLASSRPVSPQPSTSTYTSLLTHTDTSTATRWDLDRVTYKRVKCFSVPTKCLLIPGEDGQQLQPPLKVGRSTQSGPSAASEDRTRDLTQVCEPSETTQPSVDDAEWLIAKPAVVETDHGANENSPLPVEDVTLDEDMIVEILDRGFIPLANPWDIFPPPGDTSSSFDASPEATPTHSLQNPTAAQSKPDHAAVLTSTQLPVHSSKESQQTSEHSKGMLSYLPPYQKPPHSGSAASTSVSPPEPLTRPSNLLPATQHRTDTAQRNPSALDQESQILEKDTEETVERKYIKPKRKRSEPRAEAQTTLVDGEEQEAQIGDSPPSWLFDTQAGSGANEGSTHQQGQTRETVLRKTPTVHSDGTLFSYSYQVSGQNLQDFSQFKVAESCLQWAVKYLVVPKQTDNPHNTSGTSSQKSPDRVTSL